MVVSRIRGSKGRFQWFVFEGVAVSNDRPRSPADPMALFTIGSAGWGSNSRQVSQRLGQRVAFAVGYGVGPLGGLGAAAAAAMNNMNNVPPARGALFDWPNG